MYAFQLRLNYQFIESFYLSRLVLIKASQRLWNVSVGHP